MNAVSTTKLHHKLVAVTEERDRLAARVAELEAAEAKLREQKPIGYLSAECIPSASYGFFVKVEKWETQTNVPVYASPAPVPAVAEPAVLDMHKIEDQLLLAETEMLNAKAWAAGNQSRTHIGFAMTAIGCARALLQYAEVTK